jgi:uncharacterized protein
MIASHLPAKVGVGFKAEHLPDIQKNPPSLGFFEVHAENYMGDGGRPHVQLGLLRRDYAISIHGVGLSIGGAGPLNAAHLSRLKQLCDRYEPESFSEHLAWSSHDDGYLNDLLPLPYTAETLDLVSNHVDAVQTCLGRQMLLENPSTYVLFAQSTMSETDFLAELTCRTGCGLLLDVNNVFVSATNHQTDARRYLADFPLHAVHEIHLGGHATEALPSGPLLIDAHGTPVAEPVWALYAEVIGRIGACPTLVEWDNDVPPFATLMDEAARADGIMQGQQKAVHARAS